MKKAYVKPRIVFESFSLSTSIATGCDQTFNLAAQFVCGIPDENGAGMNIFDANKGGSCNVSGDGMRDEYDGFCYHIFTNGVGMLFNS